METELAIVYGIAATPDADAPLCFAASTDGLLRSDDAGHTWQSAWASLNLATPLAATAVAISPSWTTDHTIFAAAPGGVFRSTDGGQSWTMALLPSPAPFVSQLATSPSYATDRLAFAGTVEDGVYRSADGGATWEAWNIGLFDPQILSLVASPALADDRMLFVGTETGIFVSTNNGRFWRETSFAMDDAPVLSLARSPAFAGDGTLWAGTERRGLWRSNDRGQSWQREETLPAAGPINALIAGQDGHLLAMLDERILLSRDAGTTWHAVAATPDDEVSFTAVVAPFGLAHRALVVGMSDGRIAHIDRSVER